jgi:putative two-component system response regulator
MSAKIHEQPLLTFEGRIGQIWVDAIDPEGGHLSEADRRLLASIASSAAVAAHNEFRRRERDEAQHATIIALARLSEQRDNETGKHLERVASYCKLVAEGLRQDGKHTELITDLWIHDLVRSSPLHDIGKVGIPDSILLKPGKLTPKEWEIMKTHAEIGAVTLDSVIQENGHQGFLEMGRDIAWCHHEKWDGTGYPRGLSGPQIPLAARILALADVYDALTTVRPYKQAWEHADAVDWIRARAGSQFDPEIVASFLTRQEEAREICERLADRGEEMAETLRDAAPLRVA